MVNTTTETPNIANKISTVSQREAVKTTGSTPLKFGCDAPWLKTKTFCNCPRSLYHQYFPNVLFSKSR